MEHEEIWAETYQRQAEVSELRGRVGKLETRVKELEADSERIVNLGAQLETRIGRHEETIAKLYGKVVRQGSQITELAKAIERINERFPSTAVAVVRLDDYMAEFNHDAADDDTPDPLDTGIVERPL